MKVFLHAPDRAEGYISFLASLSEDERHEWEAYSVALNLAGRQFDALYLDDSVLQGDRHKLAIIEHWLCRLKSGAPIKGPEGCAMPSYLTNYPDGFEGKQPDMVKSPSHYTNGLASLGIEVIDIANALNLNGNRFSMLRYALRAGLKDPAKEIEDLEKIKEYVDFEIRRLKGEPISRTLRKAKGLD